MSELEMYDIGSNHEAYDPTAGRRTAAEEEASMRQEMMRDDKLELKQGPNIMAYPLLGAADHASFCENKLIEMGLAGEFKVEVATDRTIQLDFDIPFESPLPQQFYDALDIFSRMLHDPTDTKISRASEEDRKLPENNPRTASWRHLKSRSGRTHVIVSISWDMPQAERIAWQAAMGSDFKREALSLAYAALGQQSPVLLYSRKEEVSLVVPILPAPPRA